MNFQVFFISKFKENYFKVTKNNLCRLIVNLKKNYFGNHSYTQQPQQSF